MPRPIESFSARLVLGSTLSPRVRQLTFEREDGPFDFEPGQWVSVALPVTDAAGKPVRRSYSIASAPSPGSGRFELAVTLVDEGPGSSYLHALKVGERVEVRGPQGFFTLTSADAPALFVATGTGLAPFRAMLQVEAKRARTAPLWVLFGARTQADVLWADELEDLARAHPWLKLEISQSRPAPGWTGRTGYVQRHAGELFTALAATSLVPPHAYVCGVKKMVLEVRDALKALGVERQRLHAETYD